MQNVEFKAELRDLPLARTIVLATGGLHAETIRQVDTYHRLADGRLKKREIARIGPDGGEPETAVEWIYYDRADKSGPRLSRYDVFSPEQVATRYGVTPLPVWVVVRKIREVYLVDGVRVHLDDVEGLGTYLEFEAPVSPDRRIPACFALVDSLRTRLQPVLGEPIDCSYSDLLAPPAESV
ncbi:MAG: class IV adenylate cyclase [Phycisphaeraceae bacterium]|nr:class IV adenylate cyclase [Phycisphaeraceae bacterium]